MKKVFSTIQYFFGMEFQVSVVANSRKSNPNRDDVVASKWFIENSEWIKTTIGQTFKKNEQ